MAITFSKEHTITAQRKNQNLLAILAIMFLIVTGFVIWKGLFSKPGAQSPDIIVTPLVSVPPQDVSIDFTILSNKDLFKDFRQAPPKVFIPPVVGRSNPFLPL